ncbi:hypothetical protein V8F06_003136 [Rhypophila decipiens]
MSNPPEEPVQARPYYTGEPTPQIPPDDRWCECRTDYIRGYRSTPHDPVRKRNISKKDCGVHGGCLENLEGADLVLVYCRNCLVGGCSPYRAWPDQQLLFTSEDPDAPSPDVSPGDDDIGIPPPLVLPPGNEPPPLVVPTDEEHLGEEAPDKEPLGEEPLDKEPLGEQTPDKEPLGEEAPDKEPLGEQPPDKEPLGEEALDKEPLDDDDKSTDEPPDDDDKPTVECLCEPMSPPDGKSGNWWFSLIQNGPPLPDRLLRCEGSFPLPEDSDSRKTVTRALFAGKGLVLPKFQEHKTKLDEWRESATSKERGFIVDTGVKEEDVEEEFEEEFARMLSWQEFTRILSWLRDVEEDVEEEEDTEEEDVEEENTEEEDTEEDDTEEEDTEEEDTDEEDVEEEFARMLSWREFTRILSWLRNVEEDTDEDEIDHEMELLERLMAADGEAVEIEDEWDFERWEVVRMRRGLL